MQVSRLHSSTFRCLNSSQERVPNVNFWLKILAFVIYLVCGLIQDTSAVTHRPQAGDLLRAEQHREGSQYGELIRKYIRDGDIVPMEITIKLLENAMTAALNENRSGDGWANGKGRFLIDGFPRKMDQAVKFDEEVSRDKGFQAQLPYTMHIGLLVFPSAILHHYRGSHVTTVAQTWRDQWEGR